MLTSRRVVVVPPTLSPRDRVRAGVVSLDTPEASATGVSSEAP